jgi:ABC-type glycerol-3-phosphate transport system substrate-binding protein
MKKRIVLVLLVLLCFSTLMYAAAASQSGGGGGKLVIWDKSEYVQAYNQLNRIRFEQFGKDNNVETEYVVVPHNDIQSKVSAAIEAKNPPDIIVVNDDVGKQYAAMNELADLTDVFNAVPFTAAGKVVAQVDGGNFVVPLCLFGSGMYVRADVWAKHGLPFPDTMDQLIEHARIINDPKNDFYALGYPMGASGGGDAESFVRMVVMAHGGIIVDKNLKVTVNSAETLKGLAFIVNMYKEGLCPPSAVTWDDMGNNNAYIAGAVGVIHNTLSVYSQLRTEKHPLLEKTKILPYPKGPAGRFIFASGNTAVVFKNGKQTEMAKKFLINFFDKSFYPDLVAQLGGMWIPCVEGAEDTPFWRDPINRSFMDAVKEARGPGTWPAPANAVTTQISSRQTGVKCVQRILLQGMDPQQSLNLWEQEIKDILAQR